MTDFGLANMKGLPGCEDSLMHSKCGTPYYMAPEVLDTRHDYTKMCDVWSLGVIMYSLYVVASQIAENYCLFKTLGFVGSTLSIAQSP